MTPCRGDDQDMDYCTLYSWPSAIGNRFVEAMVNLDTQTVLWDTYENPCNPNTDLGGHISGQSGELVLGNNTLGLYLCTKLLWPAGSRCDQASIIFNSGSTHLNASVQGWNSTQLANARRNVLCHEIGHGVGLYHDTGVGGCMQSGVFTSNLQYPAHHVSHINAGHP